MDMGRRGESLHSVGGSSTFKGPEGCFLANYDSDPSTFVRTDFPRPSLASTGIRCTVQCIQPRHPRTGGHGATALTPPFQGADGEQQSHQSLFRIRQPDGRRGPAEEERGKLLLLVCLLQAPCPPPSPSRLQFPGAWAGLSPQVPGHAGPTKVILGMGQVSQVVAQKPHRVPGNCHGTKWPPETPVPLLLTQPIREGRARFAPIL